MKGIVTYGPAVRAAALLLAIAVGLSGGHTHAAEPKLIDIFKGWSAHLLVEKKGNVCYLHGVPKKSVGKYSKRGDTYIQVTHRVSDRVKNEISITAGYVYRQGSDVTLVIDGKNYSMFTDRDTAWGGDAKADAALVSAMRAGRTLVVRGTSGRGTLTTDTYSLSGFTAAHKAITKACKVK